MRNSHKSFSIFSDCFPTSEQPYYETDLRASFLPLEKHSLTSFTFALKKEQASPLIISKILHLFNGMKTCKKKAFFYQMQKDGLGRAKAYHRTAQILEAELRLFLYDAFPPLHIKENEKGDCFPL